MTVLKNASDLQDAAMADLVETYNHLTGAVVTRFSSVEIGRRRTEMAMLAAKDADGQTGIPRGTKPQVRGRKEIEAKAKAKGVTTPESLDEEVKLIPGSLGDRIMKASKAMEPIQPRAKKDPKAPSKPRQSIYAVQATFTGTSKPQAGSTRNNVLQHIQNAKNSAATVEELDAHFDQDCRGYVNKLLEKDHLVLLTEEQYKAAKPVKKP